MAVVSIKELHQRRRSAYRDGKYTHTRVFLVITDDINDGTAVAITAAIMEGETVTAHVPAAGELFPGSLLLRCNEKDAQPAQESGLHFEVTCSYAIPDAQDQQNTENPLSAPPEITWNSSEATEAFFIDVEGTPVTNSAGQSFAEYLERERGELQIQITRNEATHDAAAADLFSHTVNTAPVNIDGTVFAAGTLKLSPIQATKTTGTYTLNGVETPVTYYRKTYTLKARHQGWNAVVLDTGTDEYIPDADPTKPGKLKPIVDSVGTKVTKPWPLNGTGRKCQKPTDDPAELTFVPYASADWTPLNL